MPHTAFISLGANLGDPVGTVGQAITTLGQKPGLSLLKVSSLYRTAPLGVQGQPDFVNAALAVATELDPLALLDTLLGLEADFGRVRREKNGPRTLDLDLLLYDDLVCHTARLVLPHPRLHLRAFVLRPLAEIAPTLSIPGRGCVQAWLPAVANQTIHRV